MNTRVFTKLCMAVALAVPTAACAQAPKEVEAISVPAALPVLPPSDAQPDELVMPAQVTEQPFVQNTTVARRFNLRATSDRPNLIVTQPLSPEVEADWKEDLRVMDKLLSDQLSPGTFHAYPQAMGIKLMSFGQSEPMYIEDLGTLFTYRVNIPLAKSPGSSSTQRAPAAPPSAWDKAKRELTDRRKGSSDYNAMVAGGETRTQFDQAELDKLIAGIMKILPEATHIRHLPAEQFVVVTITGADDAGAPLRLTMKARKSDLDEASKGTVSSEDLVRRVPRQVR